MTMAAIRTAPPALSPEYPEEGLQRTPTIPFHGSLRENRATTIPIIRTRNPNSSTKGAFASPRSEVGGPLTGAKASIQLAVKMRNEMEIAERSSGLVTKAPRPSLKEAAIAESGDLGSVKR